MGLPVVSNLNTGAGRSLTRQGSSGPEQALTTDRNVPLTRKSLRVYRSGRSDLP